MKRTSVLLVFLMLMPLVSLAGFKSKRINPKKPEQFQTHATLHGVTVAADLLLRGKEQKDFFAKELSPSNIVALRLAVFNKSKHEVLLPLEELQLIGPDGVEVASITPDLVAEAVLQGMVVTTESREERGPVAISPSMRTGDPRHDPSDPRYDPRMDPTDPSYDPSDPRNRRSGRYDGPWARPGVDVVLNPGGVGGGDLSQFERQLIEKDFHDKVHLPDPVPVSLTRDRFLYFSLPDPPGRAQGFMLRIPPGKGIAEEIVLRF